MATKEIKNKIVLEGEKEYSAALKEANRNLKTLKSELKAETAELGRNATEQQKNEAKVKSLKKQISEQEKIVKTYEKALEEVRQKYGDNEDAIASWEQKLNGARATLANMKNDLDGVGESFEDIGKSSEMAVVATTSIADAFEKIGGAGDAVAGAIEDIFKGMIGTVRDAVSELWDLISSTAAKANQWTDIAGYWGTDAQTIQQYARAVAASSNSFEDLQSAISKIALGDRDKIEELLNFHVEGDMSDWEYAIKVMEQLSGLTGQARNDALEQIFGERRATKVMDLLNDWETIQEKLDEFNGDKSGFGMGTDMLNTMNDLDVQLNTIIQKWQALKDRVAGGLGRTAMTLAISAEGALDGIADFLNAENESERAAAIEKIRQNAEDFFRKVGEALGQAAQVLGQVGAELEKSDDPAVRAIGGILSGLTQALQWMIDNQDKVKTAFEAIFGAWLLARLAQVAGQLSGIILQINAIKAFRGFNLGGGGNAAADAATGATTAATGGGWLAGMIKGAAPNAIVAAALYEMFKGLPAGFLQGGSETEKILAEYNKSRGVNTMGDVIDQGLQATPEQNRRTMDTLLGNLFNPGKSGTDPAEKLDEAAGKLASAAEVIEEEEDVELDGGGLNLLPGERADFESYWDAMRQGGPASETWDEWDALARHFMGNEEDQALFDELLARIDGLLESGYQEQDLPEWWFSGPDWPGSEGKNENGITSSDLQGFRSLPGQLQAAARAGTAAGVSGIRVELDGAAVGRMVAPAVSQIIAADILG